MVERLVSSKKQFRSGSQGAQKRLRRESQGVKNKKPNALKHGVFFHNAILPGEDPDEFAELHFSLVCEWNPEGTTEESAVFCIAQCQWRKARIQKFLSAKIEKSRIGDPEHPAYDDVTALRNFANLMKTQPDEFDSHVEVLAPYYKNKLTTECRRGEFESEAAWISAVLAHVNSVLIPEADDHDYRPLLFHEASQIFSMDDMLNELALEERLDAMADRAVKRLMQVKAAKQLLGNSGPTYLVGSGDARRPATTSRDGMLISIGDRRVVEGDPPETSASG